MSARIGKYHRDGVARTCLDADLVSAAGESEQQHDVRLVCKQLWQAAIDRGVARCKDVRAAIKSGEGRAPAANESFRQSTAWIDWRAREGAKAREDDAHRLIAPAWRRSSRRQRLAPSGQLRLQFRFSAIPL